MTKHIYYKSILEVLPILKNKKKGKEYLLLLYTIANLLNEEEENRFLSSVYQRQFKTDHLTIKVEWNGKILA